METVLATYPTEFAENSKAPWPTKFASPPTKFQGLFQEPEQRKTLLTARSPSLRPYSKSTILSIFSIFKSQLSVLKNVFFI